MTEQQTNQQLNEIDAQVVAPSALEALQRADVDISIATAHRFPRKLHTVKQRMFEYATLDAETAEACNYSLRRKKKDGTYTEITGPSIRMAEIALSCYQNISGGSRVIAVEEDFVTCQGVCHDLENNVRIAVEVKNRITMQTADGRSLAAAAGCSKALRNAVFTVIPRAIVKPIADAALSVVTGNTKTMIARRVDRVNDFKEMGVSEKELLAYLEIDHVDQIGVEQYRKLAGLLSALKDGETTIIDEFGPRGTAAGAEKAKAPPTPPAQAPKSTKPETKPETSTKPEPKKEPSDEKKIADAILGKGIEGANPDYSNEPPKERQEDPPKPMTQAEKPREEKKEKPKPKPAAPEENLIEQVYKKLEAKRIPAQAVIDWMDTLGVIPNNALKLDQVAEKWLKMLLVKWDENLPQIMQFVKKPEEEKDDFPA